VSVSSIPLAPFLPDGDALVLVPGTGTIPLGSTAASEVIFSDIDRGSVHNGGRIAFGPDGMLYAGTGDAFESSQSQDPTSNNGKILRLTPEADPAPSNPIAGSPVYSMGHRNVQGLAGDDQGQLFAAEFGQDELDEVNVIEAGGNYGWPVVEGVGDTQDGRFTNPITTWSPSEASPSGIAIAGDTAYIAALRGSGCGRFPSTAPGLANPSRTSRNGTAGSVRCRSPPTGRSGSPPPTPTTTSHPGPGTTAYSDSRRDNRAT
jgi:glucose/arabinose dehydrogenase